MSSLPRNRRKLYASLCIAFALLLVISQPVNTQESPRKKKPCKNCFSVNFNNVDIRDWLKTMASLIRRNILLDDSVKGKITIISYQDVPESRALSFMKQVLEVKGYSIIEEPNLIKVTNVKNASNATLPSEDDVNVKSTGVISRIVSLPPQMDAQEMVGIFKSIAGSNVTVVVYRPTNSLVLTGFARNILRSLKIVGKLIDEVKSSEGSVSSKSVHIYNARHIAAESLAKVLSKLDAPQATKGNATIKKGRPTSTNNRKIRAVAHKESNSLVITATGGEWVGIKDIIRKLDTPRTQILLEVLVAEISSDKQNDFGIDWRSLSRDSGAGQFNTGLGTESNIINPDADPEDLTAFINPRRNTLSGFSLGFINRGGDLLAILRANLRRENFNVLSAPQILALNNQEAEINVGQDVPVLERSQTSSEGGSSTNSFTYRPSGIKLKVNPQINLSGQITLDLFVEISSILGQTAAAAGGNPTFTKRNVKTFVTVVNKQTIVIGGLLSSETTKTVTKIPILGDIPLLGHLFRRNVETNIKRNLMIFMTPHILQNRDDADRITELKQGEQRQSLKKLQDKIIIWPEKGVGDN